MPAIGSPEDLGGEAYGPGARRVLARSVHAWPLLAFHLLLAVKLLEVRRSVDFAVDSGYSALAFLGFVAFEDGAVLGALLLALLLAHRRPRLSNTLAAALLAIYGLDIALQQALFARLTVPDVLQYVGDVRLARYFVTGPVAVVVLGIVGGTWALRRVRIEVPVPRVMAAGAAALVVLPSLVADLRLHDPYLGLVFSNVLRVNAQALAPRGASEETFERARSLHPVLWARMLRDVGPRPSPARLPLRRGSPRPNLVVVISESLSRVDSKRSGGAFDRLPRLDAVASAGVTFTGLVADGRDTTDALAALLAGEEALTTGQVSGSMLEAYPLEVGGRFGAADASLVRSAERLGYETRFLSNAPLRFQDNGPWLRRLGFDSVEGGEAEGYRPVARYSLGSAPDGALFARAARVVDGELQRPYLLVLLTVSLHAPYRTPEAAPDDNPLLSALRYVDRATWAFYRHLEESGYFDDGYLLVVGDHRRMTPLEPRERRELGLDGLGRVFGCLVGPGVPPGAVVDAPLNQTDLHELATDLLEGSLSFADGFEGYNKGLRHRLGTPFTTHLVSPARGLVLVRRPGRSPYAVESGESAELLEAAVEVDRGIGAYLVLRGAVLERRREAIRR